MKGRTEDPAKSARHAIKMTGEGNPMFGKTGKLSPHYGKKLSQKRKDAIGAGNKGKIKPKVKCPKCGYECDLANMNRWHYGRPNQCI